MVVDDLMRRRQSLRKDGSAGQFLHGYVNGYYPDAAALYGFLLPLYVDVIGK